MFFFLLAGLIACDTGRREVIEDEVVTDDVAVADTWDEDRYYTTFTATNYYEDWVLDDDGFLSEEEFRASFFQTWDLDNDGRISQSEWNTAMADYRVDAADWAAWDTDGDGYLEMVEFEQDFTEVGWYDAWDLDNDNLITEREYTTGVFRLWDTNGNNVLDSNEYVHYTTYYGV